MRIEFDTEDLKDPDTWAALNALVKLFSVRSAPPEPVVLPEAEPEATEEPKKRRGRKPKAETQKEQDAPPASALELHQALKQMDADTRPDVPEQEPEPEPEPEVQKEAPQSEDGRSHEDLVKAVREIMFARGHVWMRNVLEKHKKQAKTMAEMPDDVLRAVLANPDQYDEVA